MRICRARARLGMRELKKLHAAYHFPPARREIASSIHFAFNAAAAAPSIYKIDAARSC